MPASDRESPMRPSERHGSGSTHPPCRPFDVFRARPAGPVLRPGPRQPRSPGVRAPGVSAPSSACRPVASARPIAPIDTAASICLTPNGGTSSGGSTNLPPGLGPSLASSAGLAVALSPPVPSPPPIGSIAGTSSPSSPDSPSPEAVSARSPAPSTSPTPPSPGTSPGPVDSVSSSIAKCSPPIA